MPNGLQLLAKRLVSAEIWVIMHAIHMLLRENGD